MSLGMFLVGAMKLTALAIICYIVTIQFIQKEIGYLIVILYVFAVIGLGLDYVVPKIQHIGHNIDKAMKLIR